MDVTAILLSAFGHFWWFVPLILVVALFQTPWLKGVIGESLVRVFARLLLDQKIYRPLHNITLPTPDGTTQIDHVFVSRFGIFVLETKNMRGWIFGAENQPRWTQKIYRQSFQFQNPLRQNYKHIKALESALEIPSDRIHSVICFVGGSTFKTMMPPNVTAGIGFVSYIKSFRVQVFTDEDVAVLEARIRSGRLAPTLTTQRQHVRNLKTRSDPSAERLCPKCGNALVVRTVKSGHRVGEKFWGCSAYPKCKLTQPLSASSGKGE